MGFTGPWSKNRSPGAFAHHQPQRCQQLQGGFMCWGVRVKPRTGWIFRGGWIHGFCFVFLPFFSWDFSPSFTWTDTMAVSTVQPTKLMGGSISSPKKTRPMGCTQAPVISGGSSEGKHGHPVSCENCLQRWILHHRVTRIYGDAWCSKSPDSADSCWGGLSRQAPDRVMGETAPMVLMVEKM